MSKCSRLSAVVAFTLLGGLPASAKPAAPPLSAAATGQGRAAPLPNCEAQVAAAAKRYDIPLAVFYSVGLLETGGRNGLQPFAMNIEGRASSNATLEAALATFEAAHRRGASLIDIGCMQINYRWHGSQFSSVTEMFDPARNVDYAARFLRELKEREKTWTLAVARYNAGPNNNAAQKLYVCGVIRKMVNSGFGSWTTNARSFCGEPASPAAPDAEAHAIKSSDRKWWDPLTLTLNFSFRVNLPEIEFRPSGASLMPYE